MKKILAVIILSLPLISSYGQNTREIYGKSRIQYKEFEWQYLESENFEVFFYGPQVGLAREVTDFIEREFDRVTDIMGYPPYSKTKIFLYHSITDLQQSNVGIDYSGPISGGETQFIKSYVEIAHPGSIQKLKEELIFKVTKLLLSEMLYGGSLKDMLQSTLMHLPEWFTEGAAQYIAKGWSIEMDDYIRELSNSDRLTKLQKLHGEEAAYAGQSIWNYIAEKHGKSNISSILNYIRIIRNEEKSIAITLGISFRELIYDWQNYYAEMDGNLNNNYIVPGEDQLIGERNKKGYFIKTVKISPDGVNLAYSTNDRGKYALHLVNLNDGTYSKVTTGGYRVINQDIDYDIPLFDWVDSETLGIIDVKGGNVVFILYDIATGTKIDQVLEGISQVKSISFSKNGRLGILSATHNGRNDLFLISTRRARIRRLTNDIFDDLDPVFVPNTNSILFSSNRVSDTLDLKATDIDLLSNNYNLFTFNLDTTKNVFNRITNTISLDRKPIALNGNEIVYLSDQKGIYNVFKYTISTGIYSQLTNYKRNIKDFDLSPANNTLAIVCLQNSVDQLFLYTGFDYNKQNFTPPSARQQTMQARALKIKRTEEEVSQEVSIKELIDTRLKTIDDAEQDNINTPDTLSREKNTILDTENYTFEEEVKEQPKESESFLTQYRKLKANRTINGPYPYKTLFSADKLVTSFVIDPMRGFGLLLEAQMNDLLENHKFNGGILSTTDLRSGELFAEYQYLKGHIDYKINFNREVIFWTKTGENASYDRYSGNRILLGAAYPFDAKSRISFEPFFLQTIYTDLGKLDRNNTPINVPPKYEDLAVKNYLGGNIELVYDNSITPAMNIQEGTKGKLTLSHYESLNGREHSFSNLKADIRHYQKIHREIIFATRLVYGMQFGNAPKTYLLGGMDNWLFSKTNRTENNNILNTERAGDQSDLLFAEYITSVRGYDYATLFGRNVLMFNAELRIPIVKYLNSGYISSNFFRNMQFIGFYDIGSSWTGFSPFNKENTISTVTLPPEANFLITLHNFKNPWMTSYGVGFRTMMLGYYMKFDVAWPLEDNTFTEPKLSVTLGYDF